ncbi:MAG TPA: glycosyltransferase family 4 protein [Acetobacteraceae bacterium]|nr:glycosyltransferase family 4 protein [Acetobacteraceae bacterium]
MLARRHAKWDGDDDATVFGTAPPGAPFRDVPFVPVRPARWPVTQIGRYGRAIAHAADALRADLVEVHNRPDLALILAERHRAVTLILNNDPRGMRRAQEPSERWELLDRLAGVATSSAYLAGCLLDGIADAPRSPIVLPNCLDAAELPPPAAIRENVVLFAGRVVADKGADGFVAACAEALPHLPGWRVEMIGGDRFGPDNPETPFLRALRPRAAAAGVVMHGYRPHGEVLAAMARAAIVAVPSRWPEPFGLTALEAMACGAALLCSNRGGLAEVAGDVAVAVDPDDPASFAAAIRRLAGDPERRVKLAAGGLARARLFELAQVGPQLTAFRDAAMARFSAGRPRPI